MRDELAKRGAGDVDRIGIGADVASWISWTRADHRTAESLATRMPELVHAL